jgi:hypothetical protein
MSFLRRHAAHPGFASRGIGYLIALLFTMPAMDLAAQTPPTGRQIYEAACAACHGAAGAGAPSVAADFPVIPPDFTDCSFATREPEADWVGVSHRGGPSKAFSRLMPAFGDALSTHDLELAVAHSRTFCDDARWPRGELNLPRALVTTKAFPEDEAVLTVIADGNAVTNKFVYERRIGPRSQFELIVPLQFSERSAGDWTGGVGDLAFAFKHVLAASVRRGSILSVAGELVVPTGSTERGVGSGTTVVEPFVAFGQNLPRGALLQVQAGGAISFDRDHADEAFWRTAIGQRFRQDRFGRLWAPMIEVIGARALIAGAPTHWDVVPQLHVTLNTRQHVRANVGVRIPVNDRAGRSTQFLSYFLWEWFGGGLFDGW